MTALLLITFSFSIVILLVLVTTRPVVCLFISVFVLFPCSQLQLPDVRLKFSYRDLKMFAGIVQSLLRMRGSVEQKDPSYSGE